MSDYSISATITADDSGFQKAIKDTIAGLNHFGDAFTDMSMDAKQSFANLANQFKSIDAKAKVWGDTTTVLADKQKALRVEINKLIDNGIAPESRQIQDLKSAYDKMGRAGIEANNSVAATFARLRDVMQGPVAALGMARDVLSTLWDSTIAQASKIEDMEAAFTPLVGGADNARNMIAALNKEAATTPYELEGIGKIAKQLLPILGNDVEAVTSTFRMLGDTAGGNIEKLDSITRGYTKAMLKGKVDMESLNMIAEAGVPIFTELAKSTGYGEQNMKGFFKAVTAGEVSTRDLTAAFKDMTAEGGKFYKGMEVASTTLSGKLSNLSDNLKMAGAAIGREMLPGVKLLVDGVNVVIGAFRDWANTGDNLKKTFVSMVSAIAGPVAGILIPLITNVYENLGSWSLVFLSIQKIALTVVNSVLDYISGFANNFITVINGLLSTYNNIIKVIGGKPIKLIDPLDISNATGLSKKLGEINDKITGEKIRIAQLELQRDKTHKKQKQQQDDEEDQAEEAAKLAISWNEKVAASSVDMLKKQRDAELGFAKDRGASVEDYVAIYQKYDKQILDSYLNSIAAQREASVKEANEKKADAATVANINKYYDGLIVQYKQDQIAEESKAVKKYAEDQQALGLTIADAFKNVYKKIETEAQSWNTVANTVSSSIKTGFADAFTQMGEDLVTGSLSWETFGNAAMGALAMILKAIGDQLTAMAVVEFVHGNLAAGMMALAGAAGAYVASGIASAITKTGQSAKSAANDVNKLAAALDATVSSTDEFFTKFAANLAGNKMPSTIAKLREISNAAYDTMVAARRQYETEYAKFGTYVDKGPMLKAISDYNAAYRNLTDSIEYRQNLIANALKTTQDEIASLNDSMGTYVDLFTQADEATLAYSVTLAGIKSSVSDFYKSLKDVGKDIGSALVDNMTKGLLDSTADGQKSFMTAMKEYIMKMVVQTAVYTESLSARIAAIGTRIASAVASGVPSAAEITSIKDELAALWTSASASASAASSIVSSAFTGYASGTLSASAGYHMVGESGPELMYVPGGARVYNHNETNEIIKGGTGARNVSYTFNSPKAMNQYEMQRAIKQQSKQLAFKGAF